MAIETVGVIGAGTMGNGIAQVCALAGLQAIVQDVNAAALERALKTISGSLDRSVRKGALTEEAKAQVMARIRTTTEAGDLAQADLVICRAGAMTVSEVAAAGVASLMIPYPFAVDDHQTVNARCLAQRQAAMLVPQSELTVEGLASLLQGLDRAKLVAMALRARALARPDAAARVADVCEALAGPGKAP